jgi:RNA-directed DNA polymerase
MSSIHKTYDELFSLSNIYDAWLIFRRGKVKKSDVMHFELHLEDHLFDLHAQLQSSTYTHLPYTFFHIFDNKKRDIFKAEVRDRVVHQIIYQYLSSLFEPDFIADSYASRKGKGQYRAISALRYFIRLAGGYSSSCIVLKCDIKKYFDCVDQNTLLDIIRIKILSSTRVDVCDSTQSAIPLSGGHTADRKDAEKILQVIRTIISSYHSNQGVGKGIPLGNVTSQIFANIYLNVLDHYVKNDLRCRWYVRYNDDIVIVGNDAPTLARMRDDIIVCVRDRLGLTIPINKTSIRKVPWGIEFLGFVVLPQALILRDSTKQKMYANLNEKNKQTYLGMLMHCNSQYLREKICSSGKELYYQ